MVFFGLTVMLTTFAMEAWAVGVHGYLWHGLWWPVHQSHHPKASAQTAKRGMWQKLEANDVFALAHGSLSVFLTMQGCALWHTPWGKAWAGVGCGMALYGTAYAIVHDGFIHGRLPVHFLGRWRSMRRLAAAHRVHHHLGGAPYGLFLAPWALKRAKTKRNRQRMAKSKNKPLGI